MQTSNNSDITRESTKGYKSRNQIYFFTASYTILQQLNKKMVPFVGSNSRENREPVVAGILVGVSE